jgi:hypothetical protein
VADEALYKSRLQLDKDGTKVNLIELYDFHSTDPEVIGKYLISLSAGWKPGKDEPDEKQIGKLYGFDLYIRQQREAYEKEGMFQYNYTNTFYAINPYADIKYTYNQGHINADNPKLAARYFLNAIDRVEALKEKYQKSFNELEQNIPLMLQLTQRPFEKQLELAQLKTDLSRLEREITIKIQENQMKQNGGMEPSPDKTQEKKQTETKVIKMTPKEADKKPLLEKKVAEVNKSRGMRM